MSTRNPFLNAAFVAATLLLPNTGHAQSASPKSAPPPRPALTAAARGDATAANLFKAWDGDHNGVLSEQEFVSGWNNARNRVEVAEQRLAAQFRIVDANHDGGIDAAEYANLQVVRRAGKAAPPLQAFDANRDQRLQFGEYVAMLRRAAASEQHAPPPPATPPATGKR